MNALPKISVIVPVYKVENFLSQCVESILAQSFTDFELLLIDDGSPDNSGALCDEWAMKDNRIRVFHQENSGVSVARNKGLCEAKGSYVTFVDSDDWLLSGYLEHLYSFAGKGLVVQGYVFGTEDGTIKGEPCFPENREYTLQNFKKLFLGKDVMLLSSSCSKMYDLHLIKEHALFFDEQISFGEDTLFIYDYILHCKFIATAEHSDYIYRQNPGSLSTQINSFDSEYAFFRRQYAFVMEMAHRLGLLPKDMKILLRFSLLFFQRTLRTDYLLHHQVHRSLRIAHLRQLVTENEDFVSCHYRPDYRLDRLGRIMLKKHLFGLYDFCFRVLFRLRVKQVFLGNYC